MIREPGGHPESTAFDSHFSSDSWEKYRSEIKDDKIKFTAFQIEIRARKARSKKLQKRKES